MNVSIRQASATRDLPGVGVSFSYLIFLKYSFSYHGLFPQDVITAAAVL